ncbi:hypothetical protein niasHT_033873 [Heterodera trifolii]|uniref:Uncharacterized protein n=1 Tax=Heterodera trifolii TaxID=157864 RepID=A0ABD2I484_9BILA
MIKQLVDDWDTATGRDQHGRTPLHIAVGTGERNQRGREVNSRVKKTLRTYVTNGELEVEAGRYSVAASGGGDK